MKKVAILQSNYIPWKGYFDMIAAVDEFILYDDMQFTKNDWRNRNQIKTPRGAEWISIPVGQDIRRRIRDVTLSSADWRTSHLDKMRQNYRKAPHFDAVMVWLAPLYARDYTHLSEVNHAFIVAICQYLGVTTRITHSWDYTLGEGKTERLVDLCRQAGATEYISGPAAKDYVDAQQFVDAGIQLTWFDYAGYPEYPQLWGAFTHGVTVLDLLFNCGKDAPRYMRFARA